MNEIDELLREIEPPDVDVSDDVARGEQALRRRHRWQVSGVVVSVAAVAAIATALQGGLGTSGSSAPGYAEQPSVAAGASAGASSPAAAKAARQRAHHRLLAVKQRMHRIRHQMEGLTSQKTVQLYHDVLAEHLDPSGTQLRLAENEQGGGNSFGTKLDWRDGGMLEIVVGRGFAAAGGFYVLERAGMQDTTYDGQPARVSTKGSDLVVSVRHDDGTVVTLIASTAFGNNGTSTPSLGLTQHQLLAAAADPRLRLPAYLR
jgi:hypothetical protein